jgi:hypothetical protein
MAAPRAFLRSNLLPFFAQILSRPAPFPFSSQIAFRPGTALRLAGRVEYRDSQGLRLATDIPVADDQSQLRA